MRRIVLVSSLLIVLMCCSPTAGGDQAFSSHNVIPAEIAEYYRDYNFINSFSTGQERSLIACYISQKGPTHKPIKDKRLAKIYELMKKQDAKIMRVDPEIMRQKVVPCPYYNRSDLFEIIDVQQADREITVKVFVRYLNYKMNIMFISQYDSYDKIPSEKKRLEMIGSSNMSSQEIHKWTLVERRWLKTEKDIRLLKKKVKR
ncbi:MAG: hypothetical protein IMF10_04795 [Proteobacteria bacterium]|nr:hypothetical protein [Pseudomonadota bacterium]